MARPTLSNFSFLGYIFAPSKNSAPAGLRKRPLKGLKGGRKAKRLAAFNRMSAANQELLKRSGLRENYLKGDVTLSEARRSLRNLAVDLGIAKPLRAQPSRGTAYVRVPVGPPSRRDELDRQIADHLKQVLQGAGKRFNPREIDRNVVRIPEYVRDYVPEWTYSDVFEAARPGSPFESIENNVTRNPFWYGPGGR